VRLVLQCAVCGTNHAVGASACMTCHAAGLVNLRLMFECESCFRLGLSPTCGACSVASDPRLPYEVMAVPHDPGELSERWGVSPVTSDDSDDSELLEAIPVEDEAAMTPEWVSSELPPAEVDEPGDLALDDESDEGR
jgi:hypothetical protein